MSSTDLTSYYLDTANANTLKNYIMTELSKKYNIQPVVEQIGHKFPQIMKYIANNVKPPRNLDFTGGLNYLNNLTIEKTITGFQTILEPYAYDVSQQPQQEPIPPKSQQINPDNSDVGDLYSKLMSERDYKTANYSDLSSPIQNINNEQPPLFNTSDSLPIIPEEPILPNYSNNDPFSQRMLQLNQNRANALQMERNMVDMETRDRNHRENVMGEKIPELEQGNYNNDLQNTNPLYRDNQSVNNVGKTLVSEETIEDHRFAEYKNERQMDYRPIKREISVNGKDRIWYGEVINNSIQGSLEPYRYRFTLNNNRETGIFLQNRHRNITSIKISSIYLGQHDESRLMPSYIYVYIPELENRIETSMINRKYVFSVLTKDFIYANQFKYINKGCENLYLPTPLAELPSLTFEILNPMGGLYNQEKDDLKISSISVDDLANPKNLVIGLNKVYATKQYQHGEVVQFKNFAFNDGSNQGITNYLLEDNGHFLTTPEADLASNTYLKYLWIEAPGDIDDNGVFIPSQTTTDLVAYLNTNGNPYTGLYGQLINVNLQPTIVLEITKIEPNSQEINQSRVTII